jgi:energy-coupling factor transporter transmembrane protein EcfT
MRDLEFSRDISIGQYMDTGSRLHALGAGTKYLVLLTLSLAALVSPSPVGALLPLVAAFALARVARIGGGFLLRGLKPALPFFGIAALFQFVFPWSGDSTAVFFRLGPFAATHRDLWMSLLIVARGASMIAVVSLFTAITSEEEIVLGVEEGLSPLARLGLPTHLLSLSVGAAVRFVPIVAEELESIVKAQACRGADFGSRRKGPLARARAWLPLFVPVMVRALERAEILAEAMEARCYTGKGRAPAPRQPLTRGDRVVRALAVIGTASCIALDVLIIDVRIRPR